MKLIQAFVGDEPVADSRMVEAYLQNHPEFFEDHLELLESLKIPHPSGQAISLVERQLDLLRTRNGKLQKQLGDILQIARENDALSRRLHQLTLCMLDASTVDDALAGLRWSLHECFQADFAAVRLVKPVIEFPIRDLFVSDPMAVQYIEGLLATPEPVCGQVIPEYAEMVFGNDADQVASHALIPLTHAGLKGVLAIGSCNPHRFDSAMGHLFLSQMGEIVAARLVKLLWSDL